MLLVVGPPKPSLTCTPWSQCVQMESCNVAQESALPSPSSVIGSLTVRMEVTRMSVKGTKIQIRFFFPEKLGFFLYNSFTLSG